MELSLENNITNNLESKQNTFLQTTLGKAVNNGINIGLRCILPDWVEDRIIELKDNLMNYGLKDGIKKTVQGAVDTGKSAVGIITGNFENINQVNEVIKNGGIIDSTSTLLDSILNRLKVAGKIDNTTYSLIKNGKDSILNNVENNIESTLKTQINASKYLEKYIDNWKDYYAKQNFEGMEKEYKKIQTKIKELVPIENTINSARNIETLHNLIKNNGQDFNLTQEEKELAEKLSL